jgi:opacity protein-like surface antigen
MNKFCVGIIAFGACTGSAIAADLPVKARPYVPPPAASPWEVEFGSRIWFSSGTIGAPNPLLNNPGNVLASRLLYKDEKGISGELFGRIDHVSGFFAKANAGLGRITSGNMFDEDFPAGGAYSNTLQNNNKGHLFYGTVDVGYNFLTGPGAKIGGFVGYNYFGQHVDTFGCTQLAGALTCVPAGVIPPFFNGISEDNSFSSVRIGLNGQFMLTDRLKLSVDVAYLPFVHFTGVDNHNARGLIIDETSSRGDGVQIEALLSYAVTENISIGVGGRYWTWNMRDGNTLFNFQAPPAQFNEPARFNSERWGVFTQASYHWGDVTPRIDNAGIYKAPIRLVNWSGFYIGAHVGGGFGDDRWSDRFGTNFILPPGFPLTANIAGFGDTTHASGPLAGAQAGFNYQVGQFVYGLEIDGSWADLRGENTCFSGLGGVNCQRIVNALATFAGRLGYAWDRSLLYVKGGGAWSNTTYNINANTNAILLGTGSVNINAGGWTIGGGLEYALSDRWSGKFEYDYLHFGTTGLAFNTVAIIGAAPVNVRQELHTFKLGVNYKLGWSPVVASY